MPAPGKRRAKIQRERDKRTGRPRYHEVMSADSMAALDDLLAGTEDDTAADWKYLNPGDGTTVHEFAIGTMRNMATQHEPDQFIGQDPDDDLFGEEIEGESRQRVREWIDDHNPHETRKRSAELADRVQLYAGSATRKPINVTPLQLGGIIAGALAVIAAASYGVYRVLRPTPRDEGDATIDGAPIETLPLIPAQVMHIATFDPSAITHEVSIDPSWQPSVQASFVGGLTGQKKYTSVPTHKGAAKQLEIQVPYVGSFKLVVTWRGQPKGAYATRTGVDQSKRWRATVYGVKLTAKDRVPEVTRRKSYQGHALWLDYPEARGAPNGVIEWSQTVPVFMRIHCTTAEGTIPNWYTCGFHKCAGNPDLSKQWIEYCENTSIMAYRTNSVGHVVAHETKVSLSGRRNYGIIPGNITSYTPYWEGTVSFAFYLDDGSNTLPE